MDRKAGKNYVQTVVGPILSWRHLHTSPLWYKSTLDFQFLLNTGCTRNREEHSMGLGPAGTLLRFDHAACGWLCNIGKQDIENKNQVWEMVPVFCQKASQCLSPVCQHFQELKSGLFAIIYKQETNTQLRIRSIRFIDRGTVGLLHSYREFHEDIPRSSCPRERHGNCQYGHSHFIPPIKNPWVLAPKDMWMAHGHRSHSSSVAVNFQDGGRQISLLHLWSPLGSWKLPVKGHDMSDMVVTGSSLSILVT